MWRVKFVTQEKNTSDLKCLFTFFEMFWQHKRKSTGLVVFKLLIQHSRSFSL